MTGWLVESTKYWLNILKILACLVLVVGCRSTSNPSVASQSNWTLADLPNESSIVVDESTIGNADAGAKTDEEESEIALEELAAVAEAYRSAMDLTVDAATRTDILQRLAHIDLQVAEERQLIDAVTLPKDIYASAIASYVALIATTASDESLSDMASLDMLYPLAKAYELSGDIDNALVTLTRLVDDHPTSEHYAEVQFRRGEILFASKRYRQSADAYRAVIAHYGSRNVGSQDVNSMDVNSMGVNSVSEDSEIANSMSKVKQTFLLNAWYMAGWSDFKIGNYEGGLSAFFWVLDDFNSNGSLSIKQGFESIAGTVSNESLATGRLKDNAKGAKDASITSQQSMIDDTFRVVSLSFSYLEGASSIEQVLASNYQQQNLPTYTSRLYADLAMLYLEKKRYQDSADVYRRYVQQYPLDVYTPDFHRNMIDVYTQGGFPEQLRKEKETYTLSYGAGSDYWQQADANQQTLILPVLRLYLDELTAFYHNIAQHPAKNGNSDEDSVDQSNNVASYSKSERYNVAGDWYQRWIDNFPNDPELSKNWFLLAETRFEAEAFAAAAQAYEIAAYGDLLGTSITQEGEAVAFDKANEAGYAALLAYQKLITQGENATVNVVTNTPQENGVVIQGKTLEQWRSSYTESALLFADTFPMDARAAQVLAQTTESLLQQQDYQQTILVANKLQDHLLVIGFDIDRVEAATPRLTTEQQYWLTGALSKAHAFRALKEHQQAEFAYRDPLLFLQRKGGSRNPDVNVSAKIQQYYLATLDNYAASIYQQGEVLLDLDDKNGAAMFFARVVEAAPTSTIRVTAQHDAATLFLQLEQWPQAIALMTDFEMRFPNHPETVAVPARLLLAYEAQQDWPNAAVRAMQIVESDTDILTRQQALMSAAQFFYQADDTNNAIEQYRRYAHEYPEPLADRMEAQRWLTELYLAQSNSVKRNFWLNELMASHDSARQKTQRSHYLAAFAAADLADQSMLVYQKIRLGQPLKTSLKKKQNAMKVALTRYERTIDYGVDVFATQATHKMGDIYAELAKDLLESTRPNGLSELELEQYEFLLEEQAYPFEESAIEFYLANIERGWGGLRTDWVAKSHKALADLLPGRFAKQELRP